MKARLVKYSLAVLAGVVLLASCGGRKKAGEAQAPSVRKFPPVPSVPSVISSPQEANEYIVTHFWDAFLEGSYPCDSTHVNGVPSEEVESSLGMYVTLLENNIPLEEGRRQVSSFFSQVEKYQAANPSSNVFGFFENMMGKYLYDPNSPVRDEDLYLQYVSRLAVSAFTSEDMRLAYLHDAQMCSLNQVGTPAADISFTDRSRRRRTLYGVKAAHTLLFFTNPGCPACKEIIRELTASSRIASKIDSGELAVVNIYIDREIDKWKELSSEYPSSWINGYDHSYTIRTDVTYNVRAIPSLYVLDADKKVVMKDAPSEKAINYLERI